MMYKIKEFYNDSCGACKLLKPVLERVANESNAELTFINVDENPHYISEFDIKNFTLCSHHVRRQFVRRIQRISSLWCN